MTSCLDANHFQPIEPIGIGGFGKVFKIVWDKYPNLVFVAKILEFTNANQKQSQVASYKNEIEILTKLKHPNIIRIYHHFESQNSFVQILEYLPHGTMDQYIKTYGPVRTQLFIIFARQLLNALSYCHKNGVSHHDIKPSNIMLDQDNNAKFIDFGVSIKSEGNNMVTNFGGSMPFQSPEVIMCIGYDPKKADIWSMGITLYYMITGSMPFDTKDKKIMKRLITQCDPVFPVGIRQEIVTLISSMLRKEPKLRPSVNELLENPLFHTIKTNISSALLRKPAFHNKGRRYSSLVSQSTTTSRLFLPIPTFSK